MIVLGLILIVLGWILPLPLLVTLGVILLIVGVILALLGGFGHSVGRRRHYF